MREICNELDMPEEITERLVYHINTIDPGLYQPYIAGLFSLETGEQAASKILEAVKTEQDPTGDMGLKSMAVYLEAAKHTREIYAQLGIDDTIYINSLKAFSRFVREHKVTFGRYGFNRPYRIFRYLSVRIFRLRSLEFEMRHIPSDVQLIDDVLPGSPVLIVHIPSDAIITRDALDASYSMARSFFAKHFPDYRYQCVYTISWMLSPLLKDVLDPDSRILDFQTDFEITHVDLESNSGMIWIFKRNYEDYSKLQEDTSLMRKMKQILLEGGKIGHATGYIKDFENR